jgi:hypothetical protein
VQRLHIATRIARYQDGQLIKGTVHFIKLRSSWMRQFLYLTCCKCRTCDTTAANTVEAHEICLRMYCLKTTWLCKVNRQRQSWFKNKDVPKAELLANLLVGLAALKDKGIELQKELEKAILSKTLMNTSWDCFGLCGQTLSWSHFFHGDIKDEVGGRL